MPAPASILILGCGALGSFIAARLRGAGHDVTCLARGRRLENIRNEGLILARRDGTERLPVRVVADVADAPRPDAIFLCIKTWQLEGALAALDRLAAPGTGIVTVQNGVEMPWALRARYPHLPVIASAVRGFFELRDDGVVHHVGVAPRLTFGPIDATGTALADLVGNWLAAAGIDGERSANIEATLWEKLLLVASIGPVAAFRTRPVGMLRHDPEGWQLLGQVMTEIAEIARAKGVALPPDTPNRMRAFVATFPADATSSMQRDLDAGRPSEFDAQLGAVIRAADTCAMAAPACRALHTALLPRAGQPALPRSTALA